MAQLHRPLAALLIGLSTATMVVLSSSQCPAAIAPATRPAASLGDVENLSSSRLLERSKILNRQRETISARLKDIESELRNTSIALNINGVGVPGRMNAKELELSELIRRHMDLNEKASNLTVERNLLIKSPKEAAMTTNVQQAVEADATITTLRKALGEIEVKLAEAAVAVGTTTPGNLQTERDTLREALDRQLTKRREEQTAMRLTDVKLQLSQIQAALDSIVRRMDAIKEDIGAYSTMMNTYSRRKDEEKALIERLTRIDDELDWIITVQQFRDEQATTQPSL